MKPTVRHSSGLDQIVRVKSCRLLHITDRHEQQITGPCSRALRILMVAAYAQALHLPDAANDRRVLRAPAMVNHSQNDICILFYT